jgi:hypothetical protein
MDSKTFYLSSHDYISTPEPRECNYVGDSVVRETNQRLFAVNISPPLPGCLVSRQSEVGTLLLGAVYNSLEISEIGKTPFIVDIYVYEGPLKRAGYNAPELNCIGCGMLHSSLAEAIKASPLED